MGLSLDDLHATLGKRASREGWDVYQCMQAADARADIARGRGGAGLWGVALYGKSDEDTTYCIAVQGDTRPRMAY